MGGAERFLWSTRAKARGKRKPAAATVMKQFLKWHSDADRERWMRSIAPFLWLFIPCLTRIRASSQSILHFLLKCLGNDACIELSGCVWVSFTHAKVMVLT